MGEASRAILLRSQVICRLSSRKRRGGVGGCEDRGEGGSRGDVLGGCGARGRRGGECLREARGGRSFGAAVQVSLPSVPARLCRRASERASGSRQAGALPASRTPRGCARPSSLGRSLLRGLERFRLGRFPPASSAPVEDPEMSFFISSEMNQVICADPTDAAGGKGRVRRLRADGWSGRLGF